MILRVLARVTGLACALTPVCIAAQVRGATTYDYEFSRKESDRTFAEYADCVIRTENGYRQAIKFLRLVPNTPASVDAGRKLSNPDCLRSFMGSTRLRFSLLALRPALYAALYRRQFGTQVPVSVAEAPQLSLAAMYDGSLTGFPPVQIANLQFGNCVARADTEASHRLLVARPWTKAEEEALPALTQAMGSCLPAGQKLGLSRGGVHAVIAEAMYYLLSTRAAGAASGVQTTKAP